jgi:transposase
VYNKSEHAVDLDTQAIVATQVTYADRADLPTGAETLILAQASILAASQDTEVEELVANKGYHDNWLLTQCADRSVRTYIPEPRR